MNKKLFLVAVALVVVIIMIFVVFASEGKRNASLSVLVTTSTQGGAPAVIQSSAPNLITISTTTTTTHSNLASTSPSAQQATPTGPNEITWTETKQVVEQCQIFQLAPGLPGGYSYIYFKNHDFKAIIDYHPTIAELNTLAQSVSSTCGVVKVQNPQY